MDVIPIEAKILICRLNLLVSPSGATFSRVSLYGSQGDIASPSVADNKNLLGAVNFDPDANVGDAGSWFNVLIPLGPTNQDFKVNWAAVNDDSRTATLYYLGFIAN